MAFIGENMWPILLSAVNLSEIHSAFPTAMAGAAPKAMVFYGFLDYWVNFYTKDGDIMCNLLICTSTVLKIKNLINESLQQ